MNTKSIGTAILVLISIFMFAVVHAQNEYDLLGKGARAAGMGCAFNAIADDATALSWNPAGMVQIKKPEVAFVNSITGSKYANPSRTDRRYKPVYMVDYIGYVYPLKLKKKDLVFGIGFQNKMNYKFNYSSEESIAIDLNARNHVTVNSISVCGGYSITPYAGVGISFNKWFSLGNKSHEYDYYNTKLINDEKYPFDEDIFETDESFKYTGNNIDLGIMIDFAGYRLPLRLSVIYKSGFILKNNYDVIYSESFFYENNIDTVYSEFYTGVERYHFPGILACGISYRVNDYFTISCDYDIKPFNKKIYNWDYDYQHLLNANNHTDTLSVGVYNENYSLLRSNANLNQVRIGMEYILHPKFALIPVRAGWKNNPTSISSYNDNNEPVEQVFAHSVNVGAGLVTKCFSIDFAYEYYEYNRRDFYYDKEKKSYHFFVLSAIFYLK